MSMDFDVFGCGLDGSRLVEASAGTGKTWNLCGVYLRLLLERGLAAKQILVVTFTNAATAELRERIRGRIVETLACLRGAAGAALFAPRLVEAMRERGLADEAMRSRLELALQSFDEAPIHTIHGFCQRALADAPFAAGLPLASEAIADDSELVAEAARDFWRRSVAATGAISPALAAHLAARGDSPAHYAGLLRRRQAKPLAKELWPDPPAAPFDPAALQAAHDEARALWRAERDAIVECLNQGRDQLNGNTFKPDAIEAGAIGWDGLLAGADPLAPAAEKIALYASARQAAKKGCTAPRHRFFDLAGRLLELRLQADEALTRERSALLRRLLDEGSAALREAKLRQRVVGYDDMLANLHQRLAGGGALAAELRQRFAAALIDEFQDTDPLQFAIFDAIYGGTDLPLVLFGDPKQAIYSFRNADLPTYLEARRLARACDSLAANQRSSGALIAALNALFGANPQAFMQPGLAYRPVVEGDKPRPALHGAPQAALTVWTLPEGEPGFKREARAAAIAATASEIARLIAAGARGELRIGERAAAAGDIAVLVRTHAEAAAVRRALAAAGVGAVELSRASVFASVEAEELARLLAALRSPRHEAGLRAALATELLGLDASAIAALADDEAGWTGWLERFARYRELWVERGIGYLLRELMFAEELPTRMLARGDGERRLTNWLHLAELLHQAEPAHASPDALLRWLERQRQAGAAQDDAAQLRLESDRNLVQIVTVHRAKGLEYAFVYCPLLWDGRNAAAPRIAGDGVAYHDEQGQAVIDFRAAPGAEVRQALHRERAAEELRLIYVALTRAVHRCVIVAGRYRVRSGKGASDKESAANLLDWLAGGAGCPAEDWLAGKAGAGAAAWHAVAAQAGSEAMQVAPLPGADGFVLQEARPAPQDIAALPAPRRIAPGWRIGSYSALMHGAAHAAADHDLRAAVPPPPEADAALADDDILRFPRGAAAGVCLHALFERVEFDDPARWPEAIDAALASLPGAAGSPGLGAMLQRMLSNVMATPLPVGTPEALRLSALPRARRLAELEFHLPVRHLDARALHAGLAGLGIAVPQLDFAVLRGYLNGFIDLVVLHQGRYFVVDWKSNHLGEREADYAAEPLADAMLAQGYHLQALIYAVALDRLLAARLPDYDAQTHFGGVLYLFVRGLRPQWRQADGSPAGMHFERLPAATLERARALLLEGGAP